MFRVLFVIAAMAYSALMSASEEAVEPQVCLPPQNFVLGGIEFGVGVEDVEKQLGLAYKQSSTSAEDDGGVYSIQRMEYPDITVDVGAGNRGVERVFTSSERTALIGGVAVGMRMSKVGELLHFRPVFGRSAVVVAKLLACGFDDRAELILKFRDSGERYDSDSVLESIEMTFYGP